MKTLKVLWIGFLLGLGGTLGYHVMDFVLFCYFLWLTPASAIRLPIINF